MWLITGPFDGELGNVTATKTKLLKSARKYPLGRKERSLLVNNKKISRDHCVFTVSEYTEDNMADPTFVPGLEVHNTKEKAMSIDRSGEPIVVNPGAMCSLQSGDKIYIVVGVPLEVRWFRIACVLPAARSAPAISRECCASIGINLLPAPHPLATHHLTPKYEPTVSIATTLLSAAHLVRIEWLQEYVRLGMAENDDSDMTKLSALERAFAPPPEGRYRPAFSPSLPPALKFFKFWEPSEERFHFLGGYRLVLLAGKDGELDSETRELVLRGGGEYDGFPMAAGHTRWRQMIAKAKRKKDEMGLNVAIVSNEQVIQETVGSSQWQEMVEDAQSLSVPIISLDALVHAVVAIDISHIHSASQVPLKPPLPDAISNGCPGEPHPPVVPRSENENDEVIVDTRQLRCADKTTSMSRSKSPTPPTAPLRKKLLRPIRATPVTATQAQAQTTTPVESAGQGVAPTPALPATRPRLKRRAATPAAPPSVIDTVLAQRETEMGSEPPLKKFKALFDASDPDTMGGNVTESIAAAYDTAMGFSSGATQPTESMVNSGPTMDPLLVNRRGDDPGGLRAVMEEEEVNLPSGNDRLQPPKPLTLPQSSQVTSDSPPELRGIDPAQGQDAGKDGQTEGGSAEKRSSGKLDTDPAFLTALASRKRGKKGEDEFDREFNQLRISKPDLGRAGQEEEQEAQKEAWAVLGDFDDDVRNIRGNFMVVVEMDVYGECHRRHTVPVVRTCDGRPNFKKFRKTHMLPSRAAPIEVVMKTEDDYGVGSGYWKGGGTTLSTAVGTEQRRPRTVLESDDMVDDPVMPSNKQPQVTKAKPPRLFLESDEEPTRAISPRKRGKRGHATMEIDDLGEGAAPAPSRSGHNKKRHIIDDGSDDEAVFRGFDKKRRMR